MGISNTILCKQNNTVDRDISPGPSNVIGENMILDDLDMLDSDVMDAARTDTTAPVEDDSEDLVEIENQGENADEDGDAEGKGDISENEDEDKGDGPWQDNTKDQAHTSPTKGHR